MPELVCPSAPRMGTVNLPSVTSPALSIISFGHAQYSRTPSPDARSPWLHGSPSILQPLDYYIFSSSPNTPHLPDLYSLFDDAPDIDSSIETNTLGLNFDQFAGHLQTPMTPPSTPRPVVSHSHSPATPVLQGQGHHHSDQDRQQPFLASTKSHKGDAQASPHKRVSDNETSDGITVEPRQESGPVSRTNVIANRSLDHRKERKKESRRGSRKLLRPYGRGLFNVKPKKVCLTNF